MVKASDFFSTVKIPLNEKWGYIWGTWGTTWTEAKQKALNKTTDKNRAMSRKYGSKWIGRKVADCSGLVRWALKQFGIAIAHSSHTQWTSYCAKKGELVKGRRDDGVKLRPGTLMFLRRKSDNRRHHVGVYVGDDTVIEAKGAYYGVVTSKPSDWDEWGELNCVDYSEYPIEQEGKPKMALRKGMQGEAVRELQIMLNEWINAKVAKYPTEPLVVDGDYGTKTYAAVASFQEANHLTVDGIFGNETEAALAAWCAKVKDEGQEPAQAETVTLPKDDLYKLLELGREMLRLIEKVLP